MDTLSTFSIPGGTFLLTLVFGFWLSKAGKPYNGIIFNIHKLIALGTVILAAVQVYNSLKIVEPPFLLLLFIGAAGLCVIALFASGALLSTGTLKYQLMKAVHQVALVLGSVCMAGAMVVLGG